MKRPFVIDTINPLHTHLPTGMVRKETRTAALICSLGAGKAPLTWSGADWIPASEEHMEHAVVEPVPDNIVYEPHPATHLDRESKALLRETAPGSKLPFMVWGRHLGEWYPLEPHDQQQLKNITPAFGGGGSGDEDIAPDTTPDTAPDGFIYYVFNGAQLPLFDTKLRTESLISSLAVAATFRQQGEPLHEPTLIWVMDALLSSFDLEVEADKVKQVLNSMGCVELTLDIRCDVFELARGYE